MGLGKHLPLVFVLCLSQSDIILSAERDCSMDRRVAPDYLKVPNEKHCSTLEDPKVKFITFRHSIDGIIRNVVARVNATRCELPPNSADGPIKLAYTGYETIGVPEGESAIQVGDGDVSLIEVPGCVPGHLFKVTITYPDTDRRIDIIVLLAN